MTADTRYCGRCGAAMQYRLGEFECACGNRERPQPADPRQREFAPPQLLDQREAAAVATKTAYATPLAELQSLRSTRDYRKLAVEKDRYDPSPGIEKEKMLLFAIFAGRVLITAAVALLNGRSLAEAGLASDALGALLISMALFTPVIALKVGIAYLALLIGGLSFLAILRALFFRAFLGAMLTSQYGWLGSIVFRNVMDSFFVVVLLSLAVALLELWLASVLFRDAHRLQVLKP